jgi:tetratricopeptide (TPR) repeat protein
LFSDRIPPATFWWAEWDQSQARWQAALHRVVTLIPSERYGPRANRIAARSLFHLGRIPESEACFARGGALPIDDQRLRADGLIQLGRGFEAATLLETVLQERPEDPVALQRLASLRFRQGSLHEALALAERLIALPAHAATGYALLATMHQERGNLRDAVVCFEKALEINPTLNGLPVVEEMVYEDLAANLIDIGEPERAIPYAERALALKNDASTQCLLARAYLHATRNSQARSAWLQALRIDPNCAEALLGLGRLALEQSEPDRAVSYLAKVVQLNPSDHASRYMLGQAYARLNNDDLARIEFEKAKTLREEEERRLIDGGNTHMYAEGPRVQFKLALDELRQGHRENALGRLRVIARKYPNFVEASRVLQRIEQETTHPQTQRP